MDEITLDEYRVMLRKPPRRRRVVLAICQGHKVTSELELAFLTAWENAGGAAFVYQHVPIQGRRFRCDFAWPDERLIVEIQGGAWSGVGHGQASGIVKDYARHNLFVMAGWRVLYYPADKLRGEALRETVAEVRQCLNT